MTALLERVKFLGSGEPEVPDLDGAAAGGDGAELFDPDPAPGAKARRSTGAAPATARKSATSKTTAAGQKRTGGKFVSRTTIQNQMAEEIEAYAKMLALTWSMTDEHCAAVLNDTSANIARDLAALAARSDWVVERFQTTSLLADCFKAMHSLFPLLRAVYAHHIATRGELPDEEMDRVTVADDGLAGYAPWRPSVA